MSKSVLAIKNLCVSVTQQGQAKNIVDGISFAIPENTIFGLVGGSGSGKTTTGLSILRLLPLGLEITKGQIFLNDQNIMTLSQKKMRNIRGVDVGMIFQEPLNALNPVFTVGFQIDEVLKIHTKKSKKEREQKTQDYLDMVGIKDPQRVARNYPHQLSGGMRQRAMIAQAIAGSPKLLIADEPTSNLDVTLQALIMELFLKLKRELSLSILLISHDLGMVGKLCDNIAVMHQGRIVEQNEKTAVIEKPQHQYTKKLIQALNM